MLIPWRAGEKARCRRNIHFQRSVKIRLNRIKARGAIAMIVRFGIESMVGIIVLLAVRTREETLHPLRL